MAAINTRGVIIGGLVAGLIINVSEYILNEPVLGTEFQADMQRLNLPPIGGGAIAVFLAFGFLLGWALVWLYAAIRPRFGPGPRTAVIAGLVFWFLAYFCPSVGYGVMGIFSWRLLAIAMIWGLAEVLIASLAGGRIYTEG